MTISRKRLRFLVYVCLGVILASFIVLLKLSDSTHRLYAVMAGVSGICGTLFMIVLVDRVKRARNSMEAVVEESTARYHAIISASNTGAWEYHADTKYQWCSAEYFEMLGYDPKLFLKNDSFNIQDIWMQLLHPDDRQKAIEHFADHIGKKTAEMYEASFRMKHKNGEWRWIWSRGRTLMRNDGSVSNITLGTHTDITERKNMELDLRNYNGKLIKYAHLTAHEVRGPLARLLGLIQVSKLTHDVDYRWYFDKVNREAHDIDKILNEITVELNEIDEHHKEI